ncbi:hypothetical protein, partial [Streptomyces sp. NPDC057909]|uniref:hypothetical protein n=1 Tax=Streptomyces sp. NPDC057909 TaxID=3346277 RepID=UPI0036E175FB
DRQPSRARPSGQGSGRVILHDLGSRTQTQTGLDESFHEHNATGFYIIAAAVIEPAAVDTVRETMRQLKGRRDTSKVHWTEMNQQQRRTARRRPGATAHCLGGFARAPAPTGESPQ